MIEKKADFFSTLPFFYWLPKMPMLLPKIAEKTMLYGLKDARTVEKPYTFFCIVSIERHLSSRG